MFHLNEYKKNADEFHHFLPWGFFYNDHTILNKVGSFQTTLMYRGYDESSLSTEENASIASQLNKVFVRLGSGWALHVEAQRRQSIQYPKSIFTNKYAKIVENERRRQFLKGSKQFESTYFLTISYMPPEERNQTIANQFIKGNDSFINYITIIEYFEETIQDLIEMLKVIFVYVKRLNQDETLTYLHSTISTNYHYVKSPKNPTLHLDYLLTDSVFTGGLQLALDNYHIKIFGVKGYPLESRLELLSALNKLLCEFRWTTRFIALSKEEAVKEIKTYSAKWFGKRQSLWSIVKNIFMKEQDDAPPTNNDVLQKSEDCSEVADMISSDYISAGYLTQNILVWSKDKKELEEKAKLVKSAFNNAGFIMREETINAVDAYFSTIPGHVWANVRRPLATSINFIDLIPISQEWAGPEKDMHLKAPPLFYVPTDSNTPFRFSYHVHDFGNMIVIGPPGGGKNVLAHFIAVSFLKYKDAQIFYFDKDYSGYVATKIAGGVHYDISEKSTAFQPLREIDDPGEMGWARDWLIDLLENENVKITSDIKSDLWSALESLSRDKNKDNRTITGFNVLVQNKEIQKTLEAYTIGNTYGLLDAKRNDIAKANWLTFEMNKLISDMKGAILPTLSFIFHEIEKRLKDYRPTMVFLNEAWLFFETPLFTKRIRDWLKTFRTRNAAIVLITQSLADTSGESFKVLMQTIQESIPSRIFIPNINVKKPEVAKLYEAYGLNENQINIIGNALPKKDYYLNSDIGNRKFNLNLGDIAKAVCASTSMEDYKLLKSFEDKGGDYAKAFLKCKLADIRRST